jgi:hypothetical protein
MRIDEPALAAACDERLRLVPFIRPDAVPTE